MESTNLKALLAEIIEGYQLPLDGLHGVPHWARVLENGRRLAKHTAANLEVVSLFAVLHDSQRLNESTDPEHGPRAAEFSAQLRSEFFELDDHAFGLLSRACYGHSHERTHPDITVQTCWDADRLDLGRVGIVPHASRLCTEIAQDPQTINWAHGRASLGYVPRLVGDEWGIAFPGQDASAD